MGFLKLLLMFLDASRLNVVADNTDCGTGAGPACLVTKVAELEYRPSSECVYLKDGYSALVVSQENRCDLIKALKQNNIPSAYVLGDDSSSPMILYDTGRLKPCCSADKSRHVIVVEGNTSDVEIAEVEYVQSPFYACVEYRCAGVIVSDENKPFLVNFLRQHDIPSAMHLEEMTGTAS